MQTNTSKACSKQAGTTGFSSSTRKKMEHLAEAHRIVRHIISQSCKQLLDEVARELGGESNLGSGVGTCGVELPLPTVGPPVTPEVALVHEMALFDLSTDGDTRRSTAASPAGADVCASPQEPLDEFGPIMVNDGVAQTDGDTSFTATTLDGVANGKHELDYTTDPKAGFDVDSSLALAGLLVDSLGPALVLSLPDLTVLDGAFARLAVAVDSASLAPVVDLPDAVECDAVVVTPLAATVLDPCIDHLRSRIGFLLYRLDWARAIAIGEFDKLPHMDALCCVAEYDAQGEYFLECGDIQLSAHWLGWARAPSEWTLHPHGQTLEHN